MELFESTFEFGVCLLIGGIVNFLYFGLAPKYKKKDKNARIGVLFLCFLIALIGGIIMLVA